MQPDTSKGYAPFCAMKTMISVCAVFMLFPIWRPYAADFAKARKTRDVVKEEGDEYRVVAHLKDGSRLVGSPSILAIPVQTEFAKLRVGLEHVSTITRGGEGKSDVFLFNNGDRMQGEILLSAYGLKTIFGDVSLDMALVESLTVRRHGPTLALIEDGLVAYFPFDGNHDNAIGKTAVETSGRRPSYARGVAGLARDFRRPNGDDSLRLSNIETGGQSSIAFWIFVRHTDRHHSLVSINRESAWGDADLWLFTSHNRIALVQAKRDWRYRHWTTEKLKEFQAASHIKPNTFHHVVYTFQDGTARLWLDGRLDSRFEGVAPLPKEKRTVDIGLCRLRDGHLYPLDGKMDELRFYSRALSETEIRALYEAGR